LRGAYRIFLELLDYEMPPNIKLKNMYYLKKIIINSITLKHNIY